MSSSKAERRAERAARAAEAIKQREAAERRRRVLVIGSIMAVLAIIVGGAWWAIANNAEETPSSLSGASPEYAVAVGEEDAPTQIIVYEDFLCPFCGELERATRENAQAAVADGSVRIEYRPINLLERFGDYSVRSANAFKVVADASDLEVAQRFHDLLFDQQPSEEGPFPDDEWLVEQAVAAGAEEADVRPGIEDLSEEAWVDSATSEALDSLGIQGTPTVFIDGEHVQGQTFQDVIDRVNEALTQ